MFKAKTIDQWSLRYFLIKYLWAKNVFELYYRRIEVRNARIIPEKKPVIFAANHQNALMDALALVLKLRFQTVFMTRADIFEKPFVKKILMSLKMLPIYRIRDGVSSLSKNEEMFDETTRILKNHQSPLCLFPEGNHGDRRRLRPLVKGIFRIAFKAQEEYKDNKGVQIFPVGIDYSHYQKFRQTLFINVGQPIEVSDYWKLYEKNQATGMNALRERLAEEMRKLMIDIKTEEYYETYMGLRGFFRQEMYRHHGIKKDNLATRFDSDKKLIEALDNTLVKEPELIKHIDEKFKRYSALRDKNNFRDWVFRKNSYSVALNILLLFVCLILSPLFILGLINNWPHYFIPVKFVRKIKDPQFRSTAAWGSGSVIQALYYIILSVIAVIFIPFWWAAIAYILVLPLTGIIALGIRNLFIKTVSRLRYSLNKNRSSEIAEILSLKRDITELLRNAVFKPQRSE